MSFDIFMYLADLQIEHFKVGEYQEDLWILLKLTHVTLPQESPSFVQECPFHRSLLCTGVSLVQESPYHSMLFRGFYYSTCMHRADSTLPG